MEEEETAVNINWLWGEHGEPKKIGCMFEDVEGVLRGFINAQRCLINAVVAKRKGNDSRALAWLKAGQCHNQNVRNLFDRNKDFALNYIMAQFSPHIPSNEEEVAGPNNPFSDDDDEKDNKW